MVDWNRLADILQGGGLLGLLGLVVALLRLWWIERSKARIDGKKTEAEAGAIVLGASDKLIERLSARVATLEGRLDQVEQEYEAAMQKLRERIRQLEGDNERLNDLLEQEREAKEKVALENVRLRQRVDDLERAVTELREQLCQQTVR